MKHVYLCLLLLTAAQITFGQYSTYVTFEDESWRHRITINEAADGPALWEVGSAAKTTFNTAGTWSNRVIGTDSAKCYPPKHRSSFDIHYIIESDIYLGGAMGFNYWVDTDPVNDFGTIQLSTDDGQSWINLMDPAYAWDTPLPTLTGSSGGWGYGCIGLWSALMYQPVNVGDTVLIRFGFVSDAKEENRDGIIYDNIYFERYSPLIAIEETSAAAAPVIFPNPTSDRVLVDFKEIAQLPAAIRITDLLGRTISETNWLGSLQQQISLEAIPAGHYLLHALNKEGAISSTSQLIIE